MNILVTGAAGYIGSVVTAELVRNGHRVTAVDNLAQGHTKSVPPEARFIIGDLDDQDLLDRIFKIDKLDAVVHLAADSQVSESVAKPDKYFHNNLFCGVNLLGKMLKYDVKKLIFSSSAAIYGTPKHVPITENQSICPPLNTYGESKLMLERILQRYTDAYGLSAISLRYFNAAGASNGHGEDHNPETHLIPNILKVALGQKDYISVYGSDYNTEDGTCIRDYIHVADIAKAHIKALLSINGKPVNKAYNLGSKKGYSVAEVIKTVERISGKKISKVDRPRRPGDPPILIADYQLAKAELNWEPEYQDIEPIVETAWKWQKEHPNGYGF